MESFTPLEVAAMQAIFLEVPEHTDALTRQLEGARMVNRDNTGHGFYTKMSVSAGIPGVQARNPVDGDIYAHIAGMEFPMGFLVWLDEGGRLKTLEGFGHGDDFSGCDLGKLEFEIYKAHVQRL